MRVNLDMWLALGGWIPTDVWAPCAEGMEMSDPRDNPMLKAMRSVWIEAQAAKDRRVKELEAELAAVKAQLADCADDGRDALLALREENTGLSLQLARAEVALQIYADRGNWRKTPGGWISAQLRVWPYDKPGPHWATQYFEEKGK